VTAIFLLKYNVTAQLQHPQRAPTVLRDALLPPRLDVTGAPRALDLIGVKYLFCWPDDESACQPTGRRSVAIPIKRTVQVALPIGSGSRRKTRSWSANSVQIQIAWGLIAKNFAGSNSSVTKMDIA
jgi:hypothetical protein